MNPIPLQANTRTRSLVARADGTPITAGTVNYYLLCNTGDNAGKWFKTSDNSWDATEQIAGVMTHKGDGHWSVSVDAEAWPTAGVEYTEYAKESGDLHVPTSAQIRCEYAAFAIAPGAAGGVFIAGTNAATTITSAFNAAITSVGSIGAGGIAAASFAAGAINAAAIANGAIDNATFAADIGSTAYSTNIIALAVNKAIVAYGLPNSAGVQTECGNALININLDHWCYQGSSVPAIVSGTYLDQITRTAAGTFSRATDSLEAIRDRGDAAWITATGFATSAELSDGTIEVGTVQDGAIGAAAVADIFSTTALTEAYAADGAEATPAQLLYALLSALSEFAISGTTITCKKLDGSTTAMTFTINSDTVPTSRTRAM